MNRRTKIRWISYCTAAAVCFGAALISCFTGARRYETRINAETARALGAAVEAVDALDRSLRKSACATTPIMEGILCSDISTNAKLVSTALSVLPVKSSALEQISGHISVVGDYAEMLSRLNNGGERFSDEARENLDRFLSATEYFHDALTEIQRKIAEGDVVNEVFDRITDSLHNVEAASAAAAQTLESEMDMLSESFPDMQKLVYEGKYTDRDDALREVLNALPACSQDDARAHAAQWLNCSESDLRDEGQMDCKIPCYCFELENDASSARIAVTCSGCQTLWVLNTASDQEATYALEDAQMTAKDYLTAHGFGQMETVRQTVSGGEAQFCFAPILNGGVVCYPDELRVNVSLADGSVTGFDGTAYFLHHRDRDLQVFQENNKDTQSRIPTFLAVQSVRPVILKAIGNTERFCWEYNCVDSNGEPYQICVNAQTLEQEQILLPDEATNETGR